MSRLVESLLIFLIYLSRATLVSEAQSICREPQMLLIREKMLQLRYEIHTTTSTTF
jgi:hypothetical protein